MGEDSTIDQGYIDLGKKEYAAAEQISVPKVEGTKLGTDIVEKDKSKVDFVKGEKLKFYPDNPENHRHKYRYAMKEPSKYYDPCEESRQASLNCILRNQEDKTVCQDFFDAYKECRKDFYDKRRADKRAGKKGWGFW